MSYTPEQLKELSVDITIDAIGEVCPHTLNMALDGLKKAQSGQIVVEITDHSIATKTIPAAVRMNKKAEHLGTVVDGARYSIYLKKR